MALFRRTIVIWSKNCIKNLRLAFIKPRRRMVVFLSVNASFCSDFWRKRNIYARSGFFVQSIFIDRNNNFQQKFLKPHWRYRLPELKCKKIVHHYFCKVLGVWKLPNFPYSGLKYARFEEFIHNPESVTRFVFAWRTIPLNKIVPNWIEAS